MRMISEGLRGVLTMPVEERRARQHRLVRYLVDSRNTHNTYAFGYFFCEFLNVINVVS
jgi:innexin